MSGTLYENIQPKKAKTQDEKFTFRKKQAPATLSKPPEESTENKDETHQVVMLDQEEQNQQNPAENVQFQLEAIDDAPPDGVLLNFLSQFDPVGNPLANVQQQLPPPEAQMQAQPLVPNNTMNIKNVQNVQDLQPKLPNMFFDGNSTVTINYNFASSK